MLYLIEYFNIKNQNLVVFIRKRISNNSWYESRTICIWFYDLHIFKLRLLVDLNIHFNWNQFHSLYWNQVRLGDLIGDVLATRLLFYPRRTCTSGPLNNPTKSLEHGTSIYNILQVGSVKRTNSLPWRSLKELMSLTSVDWFCKF